MAFDETLTARVRHTLSGHSGIAERKMFGGIAFLLNGRMCCGVAGRDLVVRVIDTEMTAALARPHVRPMDLTGRPLRGFVFVSPPGCRTDAALKRWVTEGLRYVQQNYGATTAGEKPGESRLAVSPRKRATKRNVGRKRKR
jgi:hypothetical protein